jgi:hypothetical protein
MDDISVTVASTSLSRNTRLLEREVERLIEVGKQNAISFDIAKTELIHYTTSKEAKKYTLNLPGNIILAPKTLVKWLGIYFDANLTFKEHVAIRTL